MKDLAVAIKPGKLKAREMGGWSHVSEDSLRKALNRVGLPNDNRLTRNHLLHLY
jgi:hypothetical protein